MEEKIMKEILKRLKSPVVWVAVLAQVAIIIAMFNPDLATNIKAVGASIVEILTLIGVLNNPTDSEKF